MSRFLLFIGHGRALESYLIGVKLMFAFFLLPPRFRISFAAVNDLQWWVPEPIIAAPFFVIGIVQFAGLLLNYRGVEESWILRAGGASAAMALWAALIVKSTLVGYALTGVMPFFIMSFLSSLLIFWKAVNRLPRPGAIGLT